MLQVARLAPGMLGESRDLVPTFLRGRLNPDGGFQDRGGRSDLYYTVFGLEGLAAFREAAPRETVAYLERFNSGESLDFVHLTSLVRARATVDSATLDSTDPAQKILERLESFRSRDGGYAAQPRSAHGTVYGCFVALGAAQDLHATILRPEELLECLDGLRAADGAYANHPGAQVGSTPATAAAVLLLRHLDAEPPPALGQWLLNRCHPDGGFFAAPNAPIPDLLSMATALHALAAMHVPLDPIKERCLDFLDTLWSSAGGFCGSWADSALDCEYTYYGLLALGHLSL